jgi:hypothetical protein
VAVEVASEPTAVTVKGSFAPRGAADGTGDLLAGTMGTPAKPTDDRRWSTAGSNPVAPICLEPVVDAVRWPFDRNLRYER